MLMLTFSYDNKTYEFVLNIFRNSIRNKLESKNSGSNVNLLKFSLYMKSMFYPYE